MEKGGGARGGGGVNHMGMSRRTYSGDLNHRRCEVESHKEQKELIT